MQKIITLTLILLTTFYVAHGYEIKYRQNGFDIEFSPIRYDIHNEQNNFLSVYIPFEEGGLINSGSPYKTSEIRLQFAVPNRSTFTYTIKNISKKYLKGKPALNPENKNSQKPLESDISVNYLGRQRGTDIIGLIIQPLSYNPETSEIQLIDKLQISIDYGKTLTDSKIAPDNQELRLFANIINFEHIGKIISSNATDKTKHSNDIMLEENWYNPAQQYVKLTTTKDGIAFVTMADIMHYLTGLSGKSNKYIHLLHKGQKTPLYYDDNGDNLISPEDTIFFMGRRAYGDTTWFENYTDKEAFFIYYDEAVEGLRYSGFPEVQSPVDDIKSVNIYYHIEKEKTYHRGFPQEPSETQPGEGWFWDVISPSKGWTYQLRDTLFLLPANANDNLDLTFQFASCVWNPYKEDLIAHILRGNFNDYFVKQDSFRVRARDSLVLNIAPGNITAGYNELTIETLPVYESNGELIEPNQVGADYYTYSIKSKPYAMHGSAAFYIESLTTKSALSVPGFNSKDVYALDTNNKYFTKVQTDAGYFVALSAGYANGIVSVHVNDNKVFFDSKRGLYLTYITQSGTIKSKYFANADDEAITYLNTIPGDAFLVTAFNGIETPTQNFKNYFKNTGSNEIEKVNGNDQWIFYLIPGSQPVERYSSEQAVSLNSFIPSSSGKSYRAVLKLPAEYNGNLIFNDLQSLEKADLTEVLSTDLRNPSNQADLIVLTHKNFLNSANKYVEYRKKTNPDLNFMIIDVEDVYKEFSYGRKTVHAYKEFLKYAFNNWQSPRLKYVFLWGDASWDARKIEPKSVNEDFVSSYGWPTSDYWLVLLDDDMLPDLQIARLPVNTDQQGLDYLDKIILNDTIENNPWMKKFLMLSGGQGQEQMDDFYNFCKNVYLNDNIANTDLCADTAIIRKTETGNTSQSEGGKIQAAINEGTQWVYFFGHGSARVFDMDGWQANKLNNKGKYGYLSTLACNTTAFGEPSIVTRNEEYVLEKDKAFIGAGGSVAVTFVSISKNLGLLMLQSFSREEIPTETYLEALWYAKSRLIYSLEERLMTMHYVYLGDPLVKLKFHKEPDFYIIPADLKIRNNDGGKLFIVNDTLRISGTLYNLGHRFYQPIPLEVYHNYKDKADTIKTVLYGHCYPAPFNFSIPLGNNPGLHKFTFVIDPDNSSGDINIKNNSYSFSRNVFINELLPLEPLANWNINYAEPFFRIINPLAHQNRFKYKFKIFTAGDTSVVPIAESQENEITINNDYIDWKPTVNLDENENYWLGVITLRLEDNSISPLTIIPFNTFSRQTNENVSLKINTPADFTLSGENNNTVNTDKNGVAGVYLDEKPIYYNISSVYGAAGIDRDAEITYDGTIYITVPPDILGFKLIAVSADSMKPYAVRNYNTYNNNTHAEKFVRFIKDSLENGDYLLLTSNGESIRAFKDIKYTNPGNIGSLDSLKYYMKNYYGSMLSDYFDTDMGSYCMIARKLNKPEFIREALNSDGDTARLQGFVTLPYRQGTYYTKDFGPAKQWNNLTIDTKIDSEASIELKIKGYNSETHNFDLLLEKKLENGSNTIDLSTIDAAVYPKIAIQNSFSRQTETSSPVILSIDADFIPVPELLISSSESKLAKDTVLRGEDMQAELVIRNISLRSASLPTSIAVEVVSESKPISEFSVDVPSVASNSTYKAVVSEWSDDYDLRNTITCLLNPVNNPYELYDFNNDIQFIQYMIEDSEPPSIVLKLDGVEVQDGDYVSRAPYIEVELYDNSPLEITDPDYIGIGINYPFPGDYDTVFTSYGRDVPLKAKLEFYSDTLDYGENYYRIIAYDNAGNSDTLTRKVFVPLNGEIKDLTVIPNPVSDEVNIEFNLITPSADGDVLIKIYNLNGQLIRVLRNPLRTGLNSIHWDTRDAAGSSVPSGYYAFIVFIETDIFIEPTTGQLIIVR